LCFCFRNLYKGIIYFVLMAINKININLRYSPKDRIYVTYFLGAFEKSCAEFGINKNVSKNLVDITLEKIKKIKFQEIDIYSCPVLNGEREYRFSHLKELASWLGGERRDIKFNVLRRRLFK